MIFDTILFDLDDTIHDRNNSLCKFADIFEMIYSKALNYDSELIMRDVFLKLIGRDIDQGKNYY